MKPQKKTSVRWFVAAMVGGFAFVCYVERMNISNAAALMMPDLKLSATQMGQIFTSFLWSHAIFQVPAGWAGDTLGPRLTLTIAALLWCITSVLSGFLRLDDRTCFRSDRGSRVYERVGRDGKTGFGPLCKLRPSLIVMPSCSRADNGVAMNRRELLIRSAGLAVSGLLPRNLIASAVTTAKDVEPATQRTPVLKEYEDLQFGVSYHFSMNTFTGNDYETGGVPATTYNPTHLDVRQWIRVARDLGARYAVLTAKHMSGFCLWDSDGYDYDVAASRNKTDVVAEFMAACQEFGLRPGFYYCILDPHNEGKFDWDSAVPDGYYKLIKQHLTELHTKYRSPFYQFLDITWKVSDEQRWELYRLIKSMTPDCLVVMNQAFYQSRRNLGRICEPKSWPTDVINGEDTLPAPEGHNPNISVDGKMRYLPMEAWIPTGPPYKPMPPMHSWFWREGFQTQDAQVIADAYRACKQRNSNLLLNLSPDTSGRLPDEAVKTLQQVQKLIRK